MSKLVERLIHEIKEKHHLKYDEDVADLCNITPSHLNRMKKRPGQPNAANFVTLAIEAGWSMNKANVVLNDGIDALEIAEFNEKLKKQSGFANVAVLSTLGISSIVAMTLTKMSTMPYEAIGNWMLSAGSLYIMLNGQIIRISPEVENKLLRFSLNELTQLQAANDIEINQVSTNSLNQVLIYANFSKT